MVTSVTLLTGIRVIDPTAWRQVCQCEHLPEERHRLLSKRLWVSDIGEDDFIKWILVVWRFQFLANLFCSIHNLASHLARKKWEREREMERKKRQREGKGQGKGKGKCKGQGKGQGKGKENKMWAENVLIADVCWGRSSD